MPSSLVCCLPFLRKEEKSSLATKPSSTATASKDQSEKQTQQSPVTPTTTITPSSSKLTKTTTTTETAEMTALPPHSRNVVLSGGARGVGRVVARNLLRNGHRVFLLDFDVPELEHCVSTHMPDAVEGLRDASPPRLGSAVCDLREPDSVRAAVRAAVDFFGDGHIDVLVNNAGIARAGWTGGRTMEDPSVMDEWRAYIDTNLTGPFVLTQSCLPYMKAEGSHPPQGPPEESFLSPEVKDRIKQQGERDAQLGPRQRGGCIVNISSFRATQSQADCEGYASTKAGLLGLNHAMAVSGARWGIRSNAILPGYIEVQHECRKGDESEMRWADTVEEERHRQHLTGRIGFGRDISDAVEWLMGANFVSGQEIVMDGGVSKIKHAAA
ncbi:uncharacterized protein E0L32_000767 [Thyridium curvatum]|uniref:Uncharacterized protein n=1 Tax=Thyridium curvatum TaxID=1093900 RepID=A0A507B7H2_9PEZI|nr:uncharacterized protein E0L32_000767 [Thyridium curvatum]TPX12590.1 hypothetical protein E0L32_000767 [Thyridium curvatum]